MKVDELLVNARERIDELGISQDPLSRVSDYPDLRAFRLYRSQKLIDPPNAKMGTAGVYSDRHLLQLVAIKALQASRLPLREIRKELAGASEAKLRKLANLSAAGRPVRTKTKRSTPGPANEDRRWTYIALTDGAFAMVDERLVQSSRPSALRALGEQLTASLLSRKS